MRATTKVPSHKRHKKLLKRVKGFAKSRQIVRRAKETLLKSGQNAFAGRKQRKRNIRSLWIIRLSAAIKSHGLNYSLFIKKLNDNKILLNRKVLSDIAINDPQTFAKIVHKISYSKLKTK